MNAFAGVVLYKSAGVIYQFDNTDATTLANGGTVMAISNKMADASTITIPASFVDGDGNTVKVVGFDTNWGNQTVAPYNVPGDDFESKNVTAAVKNITIDVTNIAPANLNGKLAGLTILGNVTLKGTYAAADYDINYATYDGKGSTSVTTVNLKDLKGKSKVVIKGDAFNTVTTVTTVTLPDQATIIEANAFKGATGLKAISLSNVTEIGANAFDGAGSADFKALTIPGSIVKGKIGAAAFQNMGNLESVTIENNNLEEIGAWFANDAKIATVVINSTSVKKIANAAFEDSPVKTLTFTAAPALEEIGTTAFAAYAEKTIDLSSLAKLKTVASSSFNNAIAYTSVKLKGTAIDNANFDKIVDGSLGWLINAKASLTEITFPDAITAIANDGFKNFTALAAVGLPKNLTTIGDRSFQGCIALEAIKIKSHITTIGDNAFDGCTALIRADFSDATELTTIGANAFKGTAFTTIDLTACAKLNSIQNNSFDATKAFTSVLLAGSGLVYYATPGDVYTDHFSAEFAGILAGSKGSLTEITLPTELTKVEDNQFKGFTALKEIALPKAVKTIGKNAFDGSGLTSIKIREKVELIDDDAFNGCTKLATINFSEATALTDINPRAFAGTPITTIDLSTCEKLNYVSSTAFPQNNYTSVKLNGTALAGYAAGVYYDRFSNYFSGTKILANAKTSLTEITLPGALKEIDANLLKGFTALTSISLPKAVEEIKASAFEGCTGLTAFKIRENVKYIQADAFKGCTALAIVNFSEATALETIGNNAFEKTAIKEVSIPVNADPTKSLAIGIGTFKDCASLKSFAAKGLAGVIPTDAFSGCAKLTGIVIQKAITAINNDAFAGCESLATVTFRHDGSEVPGFTFIGANAFERCKALTALDLSTTKLPALDQADIFLGCTALAEITFPETLWALGDGTGTADGLFAACPIENLDASNVTLSDILFGMYYDESTNTNSARNADNANTTLKTVKIGGTVPTDCFAYCTALESVEYFDDGTDTPSNVDAGAFEHCTGLKTFTMEPEAPISAIVVNDDAFHGCIPFVNFVTNSYYIDFIVAAHDGKAPVNATFGGAEVTKVKTVVDKKNPNQFFAKFYNSTYDAAFNAEDCKVFTVYVDGETVYYQACRTREGYYNVPVGEPVIIKTTEEKEVTYEIAPAWSLTPSTGWNDLYCSLAGQDLAAVQDLVPCDGAIGIKAGWYLYRMTNTADQGFGFTFFTGTTIKEGQFFIACSKKPAGAGRLNEVWLDENGNVIEGDATGIETVKENNTNDGAIYNMQGVRVEKAQKGLYIQNGKKFVVK
jgi:hypothetical protein